MKITGINNAQQSLGNLEKINQKRNVKGFGDTFNEFVKDVNKDQLESKSLTTDFVEGKDVQIHQVMVAGQKAKTSLQLLMEIRNKTVDMYRELTRMQ